jgi:hypothetical protein
LFLLRDFAINLLIRDADTIVFVLSPSSAGSPVCAWEAKEAASLGKRIIPVLFVGFVLRIGANRPT